MAYNLPDGCTDEDIDTNGTGYYAEEPFEYPFPWNEFSEDEWSLIETEPAA